MGLSTVVKVILTIVLLHITRKLFSLTRNYLAARRTGLPILVNPTSIASPIWLLGKPLLARLFSGWSWVNRIDNGWTQHARFAPYLATESRAFWIVNPNAKQLFIADPAAAEEILRRCRTEFVKSPQTYVIMDIFGKNVDSANGKVWERHRRVTVPPFNERVSEVVWEETGRQIEGARRKWERSDEGQIRSTQGDTTRVAFNVLSAVGFGVQCDFEGDGSEMYAKADTKRTGHLLSYRDALSYMLGNVVTMIIYTIVRGMGWPEWAMWGSLDKMALAKNEFGTYMQEMLQEERDKIRSGEATKESLMSVLVKSSDQGMEETKSSNAANGKSGPVLSDEEIMGNLFVYNIAGHDTTANTMNYAITMLAAEPKWQEWLAEEIDAVLKEDTTSLKYSAIFPKLSRCQAVMYETLRLYSPVAVVPRWTAQQFISLKIQGKEVAIPPDTIVEVDLASLHHDPKSWGDDRLAFRPDRWMPSSSTSPPSSQQQAADRAYDWQSASLVTPTPGSFLPWTGGPRVCPGKKFSQVEFSRAMLGLFSGGRRVAIVEEDGETQEQATVRAQRIIRDPLIGITLRMKDSEKIALRWYLKA